MKKKFLATFLISLLFVGGAFAAPTAQIIGGLTAVELSPEAVQVFSSLNITLSAIGPATLDLGTGRAEFPIPGGALDLGSLRGDIFHTGGLAFEGPDTTVSLLNFIISTTGQDPVLTALAAVNEDVVDRIPLFKLELTQSLQVSDHETLVIPEVNLTLTQDAAVTLNDAFGTTAFEEDFVFGSADAVAQSLMPSEPQEDSDDDNSTSSGQ